jgi:hypothetical protein
MTEYFTLQCSAGNWTSEENFNCCRGKETCLPWIVQSSRKPSRGWGFTESDSNGTCPCEFVLRHVAETAYNSWDASFIIRNKISQLGKRAVSLTLHEWGLNMIWMYKNVDTFSYMGGDSTIIASCALTCFWVKVSDSTTFCCWQWIDHFGCYFWLQERKARFKLEEELKLAKADKSIVVSCSTLLHWTGFTMLLKRSSFCSFEVFFVQGVSSCN